MAPSPRACAFTLIELLVTISIIAVLIGILLPALGAARSQARAIACQSNVRQIALAGFMYASDFDMLPPWLGQDEPGRRELLYPYIGQGESPNDSRYQQVWHCPDNARLDVEQSYGFNQQLDGVKYDHIHQPSQKVAITDAGINDQLEPITALHVMPPSYVSQPFVGRPNPRHSNGLRVSVGFVDGHMESRPMQLPFYPEATDERLGNGITDPTHPEFMDQLWNPYY